MAHPSGVVKWYEELFDQEGELVATATILTLVQKKSPFAQIDRSNIESYLDNLTEDSKAEWGILTPQHMVEHLEFFMRMANGQYTSRLFTPEAEIEKYQESIYNHRKMPRSFDHPLLQKGKNEDLRFADLAEAKKMFLKAYDDFETFFKENPDATTLNPIFGSLDKYLWDLSNIKHFNHHFEQFGLL